MFIAFTLAGIGILLSRFRELLVVDLKLRIVDASAKISLEGVVWGNSEANFELYPNVIEVWRSDESKDILN